MCLSLLKCKNGDNTNYVANADVLRWIQLIHELFSTYEALVSYLDAKQEFTKQSSLTYQ